MKKMKFFFEKYHRFKLNDKRRKFIYKSLDTLVNRRRFFIRFIYIFFSVLFLCSRIALLAYLESVLIFIVTSVYRYPICLRSTDILARYAFDLLSLLKSILICSIFINFYKIMRIINLLKILGNLWLL